MLAFIREKQQPLSLDMFFWCTNSEKCAHSGLDFRKAIEIDHINGKKDVRLCFSFIFSTLFPSVLSVPGQGRDKFFREDMISSFAIPNSLGLNFAVVHIYLILFKYLRYVFP